MAQQSRNLRCPAHAGLLFVAVRSVTQACLAILVMSGVYALEDESGNLITNGGFENGADGQPDGWAYFLAPAEGAEALWDDTVHRSGKRSVMLHTANPYDEEVYNNWYQHVATIPAGKKLILSGYIRSKEVTDAAIWLQCWRDSSQELLRFSTTSIGYPICGTGDWTYVQTSVVPPPETGFLTVRCVIAGKGTAWFDDLRLVAEQERESNLTRKGADQETKNVNQDLLGQLLEAHGSLLELNKSLAENVRLLMEEIGRVRDELIELKKSIETLQSEKGNGANHATPKPSSVPPFRPAARNKRATSHAEDSP